MTDDKKLEIQEKLEASIKKANKGYEEQLKLTNELTEAEGRKLEAARNIATLNERIADLKKGLVSSEGEIESLDASKIEKLQQQVQYAKEILEARKNLGEISAKQYQDQLGNLETAEKQAKVLQSEEESALGIVSATLKLGENQKGIFNQLEKINKISKLNLDNEKRKEEVQKMQRQYADEIIGKISNAAKAIFDIALKFDSSIKNLMRSANFTFEEGMRGMIDTQLAMGGAAVPIENLSKSMIALKENFTAYTTLTGSERTKVEAMVSVLDKMGLSADATSKFLDTSTKSLGMSLGQSKNFLSSLKGFADAAGLSMQRISQDLAANSSQLANFGKEGVRVFKELEQASKQLGIEMAKLFQVTEKFTTFEGAAEAAAKFNALLGGDFINSVNLLNASMNNPIDAFAQFKEAMDNSGTSFEDLDNGMKRVMAQAIGMSVEEAGKLFSQDINTATRAMRQQAEEQEKLNKMSGMMTDFMDQLKTAFVALYPALIPLLQSMKTLGETLVKMAVSVSKFVKENEWLITTLKVVGATIAIVSGIILTITTVLLPFALAWNSIKLLFGGIVPLIKFMFFPLKALAGILPGVGAGAAGAAPGVSALGGALTSSALGILAIGAAIGIAAFGLSFLVESFKGLGTEGSAAAEAILYLSLAIGAITLALVGLALYASPGVLVLEGFAVAALALGGAIAIAAAGMAKYVEAQATLLKSGKEAITSMNDLKDTTIEKYAVLVTVFKLLADQMERISNTGVLNSLSNVDFATVSAPSSKIELAVGSPSQQGSTSITQDKQQINVTIKIDSPIEIDKRKLGQFIAEEKSTIELFKKAINEANRGAK